jgi:hypothetical protein
MAIKQVVPGLCRDNPLDGEAAGLAGEAGDFWSARITDCSLYPANGNITRLVVTIDADPNTGNTRKFTIYKAATGATVDGDFSSTSATITFNTGDSLTKSWSGTVSVSQGDSLCLVHETTGTPDAITYASWCSTFEPTTNDQYSICPTSGPSDALSNGSTEYNSIGSSEHQSWNGTVAARRNVFPAPGTIRDLYVELNGDPGAAASGKSYTISIEDDAGTPVTLLTVTISEDNQNGNSGASTATVSEGDVLVLKCVPANTPTVLRARIGFVFVPDTTDDHVIIGGESDDPTDGEFNTIGNSWENWSGTEASRAVPISEDKTVSHLEGLLQTAPGSGKTRDFTLMVDGVASTNVEATFELSVSADSGGGTEDVAQDSAISLRHTESGTPASTFYNSWSLVMSPQAGAGGFVPYPQPRGEIAGEIQMRGGIN